MTLVAYRLNELCNEVTFIGGSVLGLLITDKAAPDVRFTVDVDCIVHVVTKSAYYSFAEKLREKGFKEIPFANHPICRWDCDGVLLDVVPTEKSVLGFSNNWYNDALLNATRYKISADISINVISPPYFLATKLEAFNDRGRGDFLLSHDMEDIISLIDGRPEIVSDIEKVFNNLKEHLSLTFSSYINNPQFVQALPGHLNYSQEIEERKKIVTQRIVDIINLGTV